MVIRLKSRQCFVFFASREKGRVSPCQINSFQIRGEVESYKLELHPPGEVTDEMSEYVKARC